ncbi:MAG: transcription antitermination factor NusB [Alloprevotella sp.]
MINRSLIRLKIVQLLYAFSQNEGKDPEAAYKELDFSLEKTQDLFHYLLSTLLELRKLAATRDNVRLARERRTGIASADASADALFAANRWIAKLGANREMIDFLENKKQEWSEEPAFIKNLYEEILESEDFKAYAQQETHSFQDDKELVLKIYREKIVDNDNLAEILEDHSLYWNDDKDTVDSFILKTINNLKENTPDEAPLLPFFLKDADRNFAHQLFRAAITRAPEMRELIAAQCRNWDFARLALMDVMILQTALAEILTFDNIPLNVSFNEYIEIAKVYSTPQSPSFINATLDNIVARCRQEGMTTKERGK